MHSTTARTRIRSTPRGHTGPLPALLSLLLLLSASGCGDDARGQSFLDRMEREHARDDDRSSPAATTEPAQEVSAREVVYASVDGREVTGYLARPRGGPADAPGVIVIHEWWGLNDNIRAMARRLAGEGYAALAVDLYGGRVASTPDSAGALARSVEAGPATENLRQAYRYLVEAGAPRVASIGWCFGGGWSLRTALALPDSLDAAVIYYGRLVEDAGRLAELSMPVQGHFGAEDGGIPVSSVRRFEAALDSAGVPGEIYVYEGAGHAFANPSGNRYRPDAAERAWERTTRFLAEALRP